MMVYTWGTKPTYEEALLVSDEHVYEKGEWGRLTDHKYSPIRKLQGTWIPSVQQFAQAYISKIKSVGGTVKYIRIDVQSRQFRDYTETSFTVEECIFVADPLVVDDIIVALAIITILTITILVLYKPVFFALAGVSPIEALGYDVGTILILAVIGLILFVVLWRGMAGRRKRRR